MRSIILDVDTGIDDAVAIMFAVKHPDISVKAITCVDGNTSIENVVANTFAVLDLLEADDVPVAAGAREPLIEPSRGASWVHGESGLADTKLPASTRELRPVHAVELLRSTLEDAQEPVTIVALAPLTNIALLVRMHPEVLPKIERIVFMGGSASVGNATAVAEFNIWHDPEAAHIVLNSGVPLTMYGLDVFMKVNVTEQDLAELRAADSELLHTAAQLLGFTAIDPITNELFTNSVIGDAGTLCALMAPELFTFREFPTQVELAPGLSRGQVIVDQRDRGGEDSVHSPNRVVWPTVNVALDVEATAASQLFLRVISGRS